MAYAERYDASIPSTDGNTYEAEIHERSYVGAVTELDADSPRRRLHGLPLKIVKTPLFDPNERMWGLLSVHAEFRTLEQDGLIQDIRDADPNKYRLIVKQGATLIHTLRVAPAKVRREVTSDPRAEQMIHAECGILALEKRAWIEDSNTRVTVLAFIGGLLNDIGLEIGFKTSQNWYSKDASHLATVDHLQKCFIQTRSLRNRIVAERKGGDRDAFISKFEVLDYMAQLFQLQIYQGSSNAWRLEQMPEKGDAQYYWNYPHNGLAAAPASQGAEDTALVYDDDAGDFFQTGVAIETGVSALNKARIAYRYGSIVDALFDSENFTDWDTVSSPIRPRGWVPVGTITTERDLLQDGRQALHIFETVSAGNSEAAAIAAVTNGMQYTIPEFSVESGDVLTFEFPAVTFLKSGETVNATQRWYWAAVCQVKANTDSGVRYLHPDGTWSATATKLAFQIEFTRLLELPGQPVQFRQSNFTIETSSAPTDINSLVLTVYEAVDGIDVPVKLDGIWWGEPTIDLQRSGGLLSDQKISEVTVTGDEEAGILEFVSFNGDGPVPGATPARFTIVGGADTEHWQLNNGEGASGIPFEHLWVLEAVSKRRKALLGYRRELSANINGEVPTTHHVILLGSDKYGSLEYSWNVRDALVEATWWELRYDSLTVSFEDLERDWKGRRIRDDLKRLPSGPSFKDPFDNPGCFNGAQNYALFPAIESFLGPEIFVNDNQDLSDTPDGTLEGTIGNWTWGDNGLSKTATGTTEHVQLANDLLGATTPNRLTVFNQLRRDTTSEIIVWRATAGVQTVIEQKILATGVVRLAVTDETGATTNIDSEPTVENGEWAGVGHSIVPSTGYATIYAHVLNKDDEESIQKLAIISNNVSLDFTDIKLFYSGELTIRLSHWLVQAWSRSMFLSEAICARDFTIDEGVDPGEVTNPQPAMIFRTDAGIEIYDLGGNQVEDWADGSFAPGANPCRPAWHPGHSKVFYHSGQYVRSADQDGANQATEYDAGSGATITGIQYSPGNGRLYVSKTEAAAQGFGYLSGSPGAMSYNSLFTTKDMQDFFADAAHNVIVYPDSSDSDLYALVLSTFAQLDTAAESNSVGVWYTRSDQEAWRMESDGDVFRQTVANVAMFATTRFQQVDGSGFTTPRSNTLMIEESAALMFLVANDHVYVAPHAVNDFAPALTSSDFADIATLGSTCRGASLAMINISPSLAPPVLSLGTETATTVPLTWTNIANETNYVLQQATAGATGPFTTIESPEADATSETVTGLTPETNYWYRIRGHNASGAGPWSNVVAATTEAQTTFAFVALSTHEIHVLNAAGDTTIDTYSITGQFNNLSSNQVIAYHSGTNRILYLAGQYLRSVQWDGSTWSNDTEVWDFGAGATHNSLWVTSVGSVWAFGGSTATRWASSEINTDATWDTPGFSSVTGYRNGHCIVDGADEGWIGVLAADENLYRRVDYTGAGGVLYKDETGDITKCYHDTPNDRIFYYQVVSGTSNDIISVMADSASAADTNVLTMSTDSGGGILIYVDPWLYYPKTNLVIRRSHDDGTNDEEWHDFGAASVRGLTIETIVL